jgi:hypothetical protein
LIIVFFAEKSTKMSGFSGKNRALNSWIFAILFLSEGICSAGISAYAYWIFISESNIRIYCLAMIF